MQANAIAVGGAAVTVVVAVLAAHFLWTNEHRVVQTKLLPPDTPPAEYLYLDSDRVLAYLGQIEGGLTSQERRTESETESQSATVKGGLLAELSGSTSRQSSIESTVTPAATDRFFTLLIKLRSGHERRSNRSSPWLSEIDALLSKPNDAEKVRKKLARVHEGDFVRLSNAHLFLPPYAAVAPRARYAASYLGGAIEEPGRPLYAPISGAERTNIKRYLRRLGADPVLPFVVPTLTAEREAKNPVTFLVPARYTALLDNARLLSSNLTVVGKVTYIDSRLDGTKSCITAAIRCSYFDRQTLTTFAPALQKAPASVLRSLKMKRQNLVARVRASVSFRAPVVVVLPVAIYQ